jgi:hypothetical protein
MIPSLTIKRSLFMLYTLFFFLVYTSFFSLMLLKNNYSSKYKDIFVAISALSTSSLVLCCYYTAIISYISKFKNKNLK